uniref:Uncharacterized protein n=1 Tax=Bionectria ochroleuca TaxID=29856 RepID=A0A8H7KEI3_BIOOC
MAAISTSQTATRTLTPPDSSYGQSASWGQHEDDHAQNHHDFRFPADSNHSYSNSNSNTQPNNNYMLGAQMATQRMKSADEQANTGNALEDPSHHDGGKLLPEFTPEPQSAGKRKGSDDDDDQPWVEEYATDDSKWIHRDKLAKIESQELQAAGLVIPRTRAPSKQRRDRSRSNMRPGTEASDYGQSRSRKNSSSVDHRPPEISVPSWDLRTPEEIAEAEANTYFTSNGLKGGSKIPVAKTSPLPIGAGYLGGGTTGRKNSESPEDDSSMSMKRRSRSASASLRGFEKPNLNSTGPRRSGTDSSPKKSAGRKTSGGMKTNANARPKTRSGSGSGTRPSTRSGESPPTKQPEGDPPWMVNSYKPDPRLPPDQQMLPTVARRLQQEKWEKEGTYGDVYDKDFRPLNDKALLKPPRWFRVATTTMSMERTVTTCSHQSGLSSRESPPLEAPV